MKHWIKKISLLSIKWISILMFFHYGNVVAQNSETISHTLYTQFFINPAYAGIDNALSVDLFAQRQWSGIEGAPQKYILGLHSPINNTQMSLGGTMQLFKTGVSSVYQGSLAYSYLLKLNESVLLSLGINGSIYGGQTGFEKLNLNQYNDPNFSSSYSYSMQFNSGVGAFLYSRNYYIGVSVPYLMKVKKDAELNFFDGAGIYRSFIVSGGYSLKASDLISIKPKGIYNHYNSYSPVWMLGTMVDYDQIISLGFAYQNLGWGVFSCNVSILKNLQIRYSYGFSVKSNLVLRNTNEFSIGYTIESLYKFNKKRSFGIKEDSGKSSVKSLRFF